MMKKVIFICLLSLTTCLSRPDGTQEVAATPTAAPAPPGASTPTKAPPGLPEVSTPAVVVTTNTSTSPTDPASVTNATTANTNATPSKNITPEQKPDNPAEDNKTTNKTTGPATEKAIVTSTAVPAKNDTDAEKKIPTTVAPAHEDKKETTTTKTEVTTKATEPAKPIAVAGRGFDGASFIGGIVLTLGLLAVGFMGFKYYRNQTERNYHTL